MVSFFLFWDFLQIRLAFFCRLGYNDSATQSNTKNSGIFSNKGLLYPFFAILTFGIGKDTTPLSDYGFMPLLFRLCRSKRS